MIFLIKLIIYIVIILVLTIIFAVSYKAIENSLIKKKEANAQKAAAKTTTATNSFSNTEYEGQVNRNDNIEWYN